MDRVPGLVGGPIRFLPVLLGAIAALLAPRTATAAETDGTDNADQAGSERGLSDPRDIVVFGRHEDGTLDGVGAEDELDRNGIDSYGADSIGELISQLSSDLTSGDDPPLVLINGQHANGINAISDLPVEAASKVQLLPKAVAARFGQSPSQRVINVVIKPNHAQITPRVRGRFERLQSDNSGTCTALRQV